MLLSKSQHVELTLKTHDRVHVFREDSTVELPDATTVGSVAFEMVVLPGVTVTLNTVKHQQVQDFGKSVNVQGRFLIVAVDNGFQIVGGSVTPVACEEETPTTEFNEVTELQG